MALIHAKDSYNDNKTLNRKLDNSSKEKKKLLQKRGSLNQEITDLKNRLTEKEQEIASLTKGLVSLAAYEEIEGSIPDILEQIDEL